VALERRIFLQSRQQADQIYQPLRRQLLADQTYLPLQLQAGRILQLSPLPVDRISLHLRPVVVLTSLQLPPREAVDFKCLSFQKLPLQDLQKAAIVELPPPDLEEEDPWVK